MHGCRNGVFYKEHYSQLGNSQQWNQHNANRRRTSKDSRKRKKEKFNTFFTIVSAITAVQETEEYKNGVMPNINKNKEEDREMKKSLMKKLR